MSHFTKLDKAQIGNVDAFIKACAQLGFDQVSRGAKIKDYYGKQIDADIAVKCGKYDLALVKNESGKYDMIADWWGVRGVMGNEAPKHKINNDTDLQNYLLRHTTKHTIMDTYRRQGFRADVTEDANQNLNLKLSRAE